MSYERYFSENQDRHLSELKEILAIPSVSALSGHRPDMLRAAKWFADQLVSVGMEHVEIHATNGFPIVTGDYLHAPGKPTVLVYGRS
ncbi:hypothetical protein M3194_20800 [Paenibacillus glycanilyticus]|uniref:hypothetical protein n=1 Tax=Paenibacillus glycanilyticus TaxID=126569 RepID=UPI00203E4697|nr:hypothetical protein [Paenibacillus glycanilyticus]MCM3629783.1 hypothetical protein [Paenibacillus glycanilyticus]